MITTVHKMTENRFNCDIKPVNLYAFIQPQKTRCHVTCSVLDILEVIKGRWLIGNSPIPLRIKTNKAVGLGKRVGISQSMSNTQVKSARMEQVELMKRSDPQTQKIGPVNGLLFYGFSSGVEGTVAWSNWPLNSVVFI